MGEWLRQGKEKSVTCIKLENQLGSPFLMFCQGCFKLAGLEAKEENKSGLHSDCVPTRLHY